MLNPCDAAFRPPCLPPACRHRHAAPPEPRDLAEPRGRWQGRAGAVARPRTTEEVAAVLARLRRRPGRRGALGAAAPGWWAGRPMPEGPAPLVLSLERMAALRGLWPAENVLIAVEAGHDAGRGAGGGRRMRGGCSRCRSPPKARRRSAAILPPMPAARRCCAMAMPATSASGSRRSCPTDRSWHGLKRLQEGQHRLRPAQPADRLRGHAGGDHRRQPAALPAAGAPGGGASGRALAAGGAGAAGAGRGAALRVWSPAFELIARTGFDFPGRGRPRDPLPFAGGARLVGAGRTGPAGGAGCRGDHGGAVRRGGGCGGAGARRRDRHLGRPAMNMITNHLPTAELQKLDAAHHLHPFTDKAALAAKGARVITRGEGVWLTDSEGHRIIDGMAGLWCVNIGYGRKELADGGLEAADGGAGLLQHLLPDHPCAGHRAGGQDRRTGAGRSEPCVLRRLGVGGERHQHPPGAPLLGRQGQPERKT
jgi:hypothetical protein